MYGASIRPDTNTLGTVEGWVVNFNVVVSTLIPGDNTIYLNQPANFTDLLVSSGERGHREIYVGTNLVDEESVVFPFWQLGYSNY